MNETIVFVMEAENTFQPVWIARIVPERLFPDSLLKSDLVTLSSEKFECTRLHSFGKVKHVEKYFMNVRSDKDDCIRFLAALVTDCIWH